MRVSRIVLYKQLKCFGKWVCRKPTLEIVMAVALSFNKQLHDNVIRHNMRVQKSFRVRFLQIKRTISYPEKRQKIRQNLFFAKPFFGSAQQKKFPKDSVEFFIRFWHFEHISMLLHFCGTFFFLGGGGAANLLNFFQSRFFWLGFFQVQIYQK